MKEFNYKSKEIFDAKCTAGGEEKRQETLQGKKETAEDKEFYQNQKEGKVCYTIYFSFYLGYLTCFFINICYDLVLVNNSASPLCWKACRLQQDQIINVTNSGNWVESWRTFTKKDPHLFLQGGYCTSFVDQKWQKPHTSQQKQEVQAQTSKAKSDVEILNMSKLAVFDDSDKDVEDFTLSDQCDDYMPKIKKKKY